MFFYLYTVTFAYQFKTIEKDSKQVSDSIEIENEYCKANSRFETLLFKQSLNAVHRHFEQRQGAAVILLIRAHGYATHYLSQ